MDHPQQDGLRGCCAFSFYRAVSEKIRQELKFLAQSESGLKPTLETVLTGSPQAGISIPAWGEPLGG